MEHEVRNVRVRNRVGVSLLDYCMGSALGLAGVKELVVFDGVEAFSRDAEMSSAGSKEQGLAEIEHADGFDVLQREGLAAGLQTVTVARDIARAQRDLAVVGRDLVEAYVPVRKAGSLAVACKDVGGRLILGPSAPVIYIVIGQGIAFQKALFVVDAGQAAGRTSEGIIRGRQGVKGAAARAFYEVVLQTFGKAFARVFQPGRSLAFIGMFVKVLIDDPGQLLAAYAGDFFFRERADDGALHGTLPLGVGPAGSDEIASFDVIGDQAGAGEFDELADGFGQGFRLAVKGAASFREEDDVMTAADAANDLFDGIKVGVTFVFIDGGLGPVESGTVFAADQMLSRDEIRVASEGADEHQHIHFRQVIGHDDGGFQAGLFVCFKGKSAEHQRRDQMGGLVDNEMAKSETIFFHVLLLHLSKVRKPSRK